MKLLALETATDQGSAALWLDGQILARECPPGPQSSATLLPLVRDLLAENGLRVADLDGIAFGAGPGSFTGLRVACGVAQGLAVATDLPVVPVGTLEAMAWASGTAVGEKVAAYLDARMGEVYSGFYQRQETGVLALGPVTVNSPATAPLPEGPGWIACGNGIGAYGPLADRLAALALPTFPDRVPAAAAVAALAAPRLQRGEGLDAALAAPTYVRDKVAQTVAERLAAGGKA